MTIVADRRIRRNSGVGRRSDADELGRRGRVDAGRTIQAHRADEATIRELVDRPCASKPEPKAAVGSRLRCGPTHRASPPDVAGAPMSSRSPSNMR